MWLPDKDCAVPLRIPKKKTVGYRAVLSILIGPAPVSARGASYTAQRRIDTILVDGNVNEASWVNVYQHNQSG